MSGCAGDGVDRVTSWTGWTSWTDLHPSSTSSTMSISSTPSLLFHTKRDPAARHKSRRPKPVFIVSNPKQIVGARKQRHRHSL